MKKLGTGITMGIIAECCIGNVKSNAKVLPRAKKVLIFETKQAFIAMLLDRIMNKIHNISMPIPCTHKTAKCWKERFFGLGLNGRQIKIKKNGTILWSIFDLQ